MTPPLPRRQWLRGAAAAPAAVLALLFSLWVLYGTGWEAGGLGVVLTLLGIPYQLIEGATWLDEAARKVREGVSLSRALAISGLFPPVLIHLIASGEQSGKLDVMLNRVAKQQEQEVSGFVGTLTSLLEPVLILVMGAVVLIIVLAILMPIISMNQLIK